MAAWKFMDSEATPTSGTNSNCCDDVETGGKLDESLNTKSETNTARGSTEEDESKTPFLTPTGSRRTIHVDRTFIVGCLIVLIGAGVSGAFLALGISGAHRDQALRFERQASELVKAIQARWNDYAVAALWVHEACRSTADQPETADFLNICSREDFGELYEYLLAGGLDFLAVSFIPIVKHENRKALQDEARAYYRENYPNATYYGITGYEQLPGTTEYVESLRFQQEVYYPVHYVEPVSGNELVLDFDASSAKVFGWSDLSQIKWNPQVTRRFTTTPVANVVDVPGYPIVLFHPGIQLSTNPESKPRDFSGLFIHTTSLIKRAAEGQAETTSVYLFDESDDRFDEPAFLSGGHICPGKDSVNLEFVEDVEISDLKRSGIRCKFESIPIEQRFWTVAVCSLDDSYDAELLYIVLGGVLIFVACLFVAVWFYTTMQRAAKIDHIKATAEADKAALIVDTAQKAALSERELNEYIAHEVRNPLTAAISACSFVASAVNEDMPFADSKSQKSVQEDVHIISSSLRFINDLLRSMLDMQKAQSNQLQLNISPTDVLRDVLEPVATMLYRRGDDFVVHVDCPKNLVISTDRLRLKQIVLNLASNSRKFVQRGFINLRAAVVDGAVRIYVEDSGPGIPLVKREKLFAKFQESLDSLSQGTGMGLCLCEKLTELLDGELRLDETYASGIEGCPGSRFVILLSSIPLDLDSAALDRFESSLSAKDASTILSTDEKKALLLLDHAVTPLPGLPENLSVLIVDDDLVLRKLLSRSLKRITPTWSIHEAANGETALRMTDSVDRPYDLIFLDQYMASIEKQLLGTETARELRARGVQSLICGLSANTLEEPFRNAGADAFMLKPFPCEKEALNREVHRILDTRQPQQESTPLSQAHEATTFFKEANEAKEPLLTSLPEQLSVLVVDDDLVLRKLISRSLRRVQPAWLIKEAVNGETALSMTNTDHFDLIFLDQYMASTEKQLLGTETAKALRVKSVVSKICGLSANDMEGPFIDAGADAFMQKPFPCETIEMSRELLRVLNSRRLRDKRADAI